MKQRLEPEPDDETVRNITHPEGNVTGFANKDEAIEGKWMQLLKEVVPSLQRVN